MPFKRHKEFNAADFFVNRNGLINPPYRITTIGVTFGGPLQIPSPAIRVPAGTEVKLTIRRTTLVKRDNALTSKLQIQEGDLILFAADQWLNACEILGKIRLYCADVLKAQGKLVIPADQFNFLWVIEFPLLGFDRELNRWYSSHHPFTAPVADDIPLLKADPKKVRGQNYDIVVNGVELGGGSIRIHQPDVQKTIFEDILAISPEETLLRFGYMLEAFKYGAPPHGGIALGFDRLIAILCGTPSIRDVIAFPKTAKGVCLMTDSPSTVSPRQLRDLHIKLDLES